MTRILLVDDHPLFLDGVRAALTGATDLEVVGEAHDGGSGIALAAEVAPDVVLMDLNLPDISGVEATARILREAPTTRVLMMTMSVDDDAVVAAMRAGARGYVVKGAGREDLLDAIRTVASGGAVFSPTVADRLGRFFTGLATGGGREAFPQLTGREMEILDLVARGLENRRIARELHLSDKTVRNHVSNVLTKLGVAHRSEAIARARAAGLGDGASAQRDTPRWACFEYAAVGRRSVNAEPPRPLRGGDRAVLAGGHHALRGPGGAR